VSLILCVVTGAYAYYECDLYKRYEVYGALLLGVTAVLCKSGYQEHGGKLYKYCACVRVVCVHVECVCVSVSMYFLPSNLLDICFLVRPFKYIICVLLP